MRITNNNLIFFLISAIGFFIAITSTLYLPDRFFGDTIVIIIDRFHEIGLIGSYPFTIWFYNVTGLKYLPFGVIGGLQWILVTYIFYRIGIPKYLHRVSIKNTLILVMFLITAIYLSMPAKDFINLVYIAIIVFLFKSRKYSTKKTAIIGIMLLLFFSYFFRSYYIIVALLTIVMYFASYIKIKNRRLSVILSALLILVCMSLSYGVVKGKFMSQIARYDINQARDINVNANSMIISPLPPNTWYGEVFSIFYGFFSVNLPFNALKYFLKPQIIAFVLWQLFFFFIFFKRLGNCLKEGNKNNYELWLFYMLIGFFIVQGLFEPDLGSSVRHKAGIFPLIYYLFYYEDFRKKLS